MNHLKTRNSCMARMGDFIFSAYNLSLRGVDKIEDSREDYLRLHRTDKLAATVQINRHLKHRRRRRTEKEVEEEEMVEKEEVEEVEEEKKKKKKKKKKKN